MAKANYENLEVYKRSYRFVLDIYEATKEFPKSEEYGIISQIRRAILSVPANIVEGSNKYSYKEYLRFLYTSRGSIEEVKFFTRISKDLKYINEGEFDRLENESTEIAKMLNGLIKKVSEEGIKRGENIN